MEIPKADLFPDAVPAAFGTALRLGRKGAHLSPAQQRFGRLFAKIDKLKNHVVEIETLADAYRPLYQRTLMPLREQQMVMMRRMAL